jgi:hypothetical protein
LAFCDESETGVPLTRNSIGKEICIYHRHDLSRSSEAMLPQR